MFTNEIARIQNESLRNAVTEYMTTAVPAYFFEIGASSSGKYHPCFSQGQGGLVRHTKAVVMMLDELMKLSANAYMPQEYKDAAYAAAIMHDTCKYGMTAEMDKSQYADHAKNAAINWETFCAEAGLTFSPFIGMAIRSHMGQWTTEKEDKPFTNIDRVVHMADYIASRSFIDIPALHTEGQE
jgi:HD superfamily phosphohydrolase YqeK